METHLCNLCVFCIGCLITVSSGYLEYLPNIRVLYVFCNTWSSTFSAMFDHLHFLQCLSSMFSTMSKSSTFSAMWMSVCIFCNVRPLCYAWSCAFSALYFLPNLFLYAFWPLEISRIYIVLAALNISYTSWPKTPWSLNGQKMKRWILTRMTRVQIHWRPQEDVIDERMGWKHPE